MHEDSPLAVIIREYLASGDGRADHRPAWVELLGHPSDMALAADEILRHVNDSEVMRQLDDEGVEREAQP